MNLILQRQGVSNWLRTNYNHLLTPGAGNSAPPFYAEIQQCLPAKRTSPQFIARVRFQEKEHRLPQAGRPQGQTYPSLNHCRRELAALLTRLTGETVTVDERVEMYCHPGVPGDIEFQRARYEEGSDTIRSVPENYCLIAFEASSFKPSQPLFDVDAATSRESDVQNGITLYCHWQTICRKAYDAYLQPVNQPGTPHGKAWLAWLISEYRKYGYNA